MIDLGLYQAAFAVLPEGVREAELNAERTERTTLNVKHGTLSDGQSGSVTRYYVRATAKQTGVAYTEKADEAPEDVIARAVDSAAYAADALPEPMNPQNSLRLGRETAPVDPAEAIRFAALAEKLAGEIDGVEAVIGCTVSLCAREMRTVNSHGLDAAWQSHWVESSLNVRMKRGGAHAPGYAYVSAPSLHRLDAQAFAVAAAADGSAYDGGGVKPCAVPSGSYDAVLSGRVMRNILMTAWMSFSGEAMLAGKSVFQHKPGTRIGSRALTIVNAPSHPMLGQAWHTDSEGTEIRRTTLVENGILKTPLYTLASGRAAQMPSTGSTGRVPRMTGSRPIALTTVPSILYVKPGDEAQEALIKRMGTGLLLTYSLDLFHSVNVASGAFSIPCGGVFYRDGQPVGAVSQITVAGNLRDLFGNIECVANDLDFDNFYLETYTIGSPSALVRGLDFSA